jgi:hypothetical protein
MRSCFIHEETKFSGDWLIKQKFASLSCCTEPWKNSFLLIMLQMSAKMLYHSLRRSVMLIRAALNITVRCINLPISDGFG